MMRPYAAELSVVHRLIDAGWILGSLLFSSWLWTRPWGDQYLIAGLLAVGLFHFFGEIGGLYKSWRGSPLIDEIGKVAVAWVGVTFGLLLLAYGTKTSEAYSRLVIASWFILAPAMLSVSRTILRTALREMRRRGYNWRRVAILGAGEVGQHVGKTILASPWMGLRLLGYYDDRHPGEGRINEEPVAPLQGNGEALLAAARRGELDIVYITLPMRAEARIQMLLDKLADTTVSVYVVPDILMLNLLHGRWMNLGTIPAVSVVETPFYGDEGLLKRIQDVGLSVAILFLVAIPMLLIALGVRFSSSGPVLFRQRRYGLDGRAIDVWKFRTMRVCENGREILQATHDDPRVTRFGAFLRRTSLDELPQFLNVLKGEMSIVGPRPHAVAHNEQYRRMIRGYMLRHKVKPGITGWAQVNGWRGDTDCLEKMERRVEHDFWYIRHWSPWLDVKIIALTIFRGFVNKNAY